MDRKPPAPPPPDSTDEWLDLDIQDVDGSIGVSDNILPAIEASPIFRARRPTLTDASEYAFVDRHLATKSDVSATGVDLVKVDRVNSTKYPTPVVPADNGIITLPVEFISDGGARSFMHRYNTTFNHPSMRVANIVYVLLPKNQLDGVSSLAADLGGSILYSA